MYKSDAAWRLPSRHWDVSVFQGSTQSAHPERPGPNLQFSPRFLAILMATWRPHGTSSDRRICQWPTPRIITEGPQTLQKFCVWSIRVQRAALGHRNRRIFSRARRSSDKTPLFLRDFPHGDTGSALGEEAPGRRSTVASRSTVVAIPLLGPRYFDYDWTAGLPPPLPRASFGSWETTVGESNSPRRRRKHVFLDFWPPHNRG